MLAHAPLHQLVQIMLGAVQLCTSGLQQRARRWQAEGIRFFSFRNEQAAGYAAASAGFFTGQPGVLLTVSGPGAVHGIAGLAHAHANAWPLLMISGSAEQVGCISSPACCFGHHVQTSDRGHAGPWPFARQALPPEPHAPKQQLRTAAHPFARQQSHGLTSGYACWLAE